jgi:hypothetical protein
MARQYGMVFTDSPISSAFAAFGQSAYPQNKGTQLIRDFRIFFSPAGSNLTF